MNAQLLFDALSPRVLRCWLLLASLLIGSGCDWLALPICQLDPMTTGCPDGGVTRDLSAVNPDSPLGPLRKFEERAKITNDEKQKFVGILQREYAIMLSNKPVVNFSAVQFHLDRVSGPMRLEQIACPNCPQVTNIKLPGDNVYLTNDTAPKFWLFRPTKNVPDESYTFEGNGDLKKINGNFDLKINRRPFLHPILDAILIPTKSEGGKSSDMLRLSLGSTSYIGEHVQNGAVTAAMIGDIDATDPGDNGVEVVRFDGATVVSVYHYDPGSGNEQVDADLLRAISNQISRRIVSADETIGAAYVNDLNKDRSLDLIFSLGVNVFVSSYKGRDNQTGIPAFEAWPEKILDVPAGEKIQSIMAIDITNDLYPDLIVVTDKSVHFYLNTPK